MEARRRLPDRPVGARLLACGIDWCLFAAWAGLVFVVSRCAIGDHIAWTDVAWKSQLIGASLTTLPFAVYLAVSDASRRGATFGKRVVGLGVATLDGARLSTRAAVVRTLVKLLPWELGHTAAHQLMVAGIAGREPVWWALPLAIAAQAAAFVWLATACVGRGRAVHDRLAGTVVERQC